jgi:hypothetical protein
VSSDLVTHTAIAATATMGEDPFEVVFQPAKPTLDAVIALRDPLAKLEKLRRAGLTPFDPQRAVDLCRYLPGEMDLLRAQVSLAEAERQSALEWWFHCTIGLMLQSMASGTECVPNDAYRCGLADSVYRDPEVWGDYGPGFSVSVIVRSIREARRREADTRPSAGWFLASCQRHREYFKTLAQDAETLLKVRYYMEDLPRAPAVQYDDDDDVPF